MENASKALLMSAGILLAIMIISLGTYLFTVFGNYSKEINNTITSNDIQEFNEQFTRYETDQNNSESYCTAYDIITVINLAKNTNEKNEYEKTNSRYITVTVTGASININSTIEELNNFINNCAYESNGNINRYNCTIGYSNSGTINKIQFSKKN